MQDAIFRERNDDQSLKKRRVCIARLLEEFNKFFPAKSETNWERRYFSPLTVSRRMEPLALDRATGTDREQPDSVKESCERNEFDMDFDERMQAKAIKLANIIHAEKNQHKPHKHPAIHFLARQLIRSDKSLGYLTIDPDLQAMARDKSR